MKTLVSKKSGLKITWLGHSAFRFDSPTGAVVLVDPWLDNPLAPDGAKEIEKVDLICVTHGHSDHLGNTIEIATRTGSDVICIYEIALYLQKQGVQKAQGMNKGGTIDVNGIRVTMVDAQHSSGIDAEGEILPGGEAAGFVLEFENGFTVYHAGDTSLFGDMKLIGEFYKPDVALLPIGGVYTMDPRAAARAFSFIRPRHVIGMHYGTFPLLSGTPAELKKLLPAALRRRVAELRPGVTVSLS